MGHLSPGAVHREEKERREQSWPLILLTASGDSKKGERDGSEERERERERNEKGVKAKDQLLMASVGISYFAHSILHVCYVVQRQADG